MNYMYITPIPIHLHPPLSHTYSDTIPSPKSPYHARRSRIQRRDLHTDSSPARPARAADLLAKQSRYPPAHSPPTVQCFSVRTCPLVLVSTLLADLPPWNRVRNPKESAVHRSTNVPYGQPFVTGLNLPTETNYSTRDGDIRDIWKLAIEKCNGKILSVRGADIHEIDMRSFLKYLFHKQYKLTTQQTT